MRFTVPSIVSLAALSSAAAVVPRADYGYWDFSSSVTYPVSNYKSWHVSAVYYNTELAAPINVTCSHRELLTEEGRKTEDSCSDPSFTYDFGGVGQARTTTNVTLRQTVDLWGEKVTISGTEEFFWDFSGGAGFTGRTQGKIDVDSAIA
ncbi:hypothetical protein B0J11DRAFT_516737 [Dendryphion nanum]|uniref:AA1-like domain-containing protein n=1 Tax=Dendryphion nanum TaxID=256645 RepID=A0A9P9EJN8_9PLEO|nr:hypothetical protein B0J11DRAFT_516737 [Dendryphion nanum]